MNEIWHNIHGTTIIGVRHKGQVAMGGDGQVTFGDTVVKHHSKKVRKLQEKSILVGFAGTAADAFTLYDKFEKKLEQYQGNIYRSAVELAKDWRSDRYLRRLEALLAVLNKDKSLVISGQGDVIEPDDGIIAIGSGGPYALDYGHRCVVNGVHLSVQEGEIVGLLGPNGAGKTTTFYMITGMIKPDEGDIFVNGQNITKFPMYKRARLGIGYLSQEPSVFKRLTVRDNIQAILEAVPISNQEREQRLTGLMNDFGIAHLAKNKTYKLSGGERRRVEIARALATNPSFILLDEPFAGVDPIAVEEIQSIVRGLKNRNIGVLITDHNVHETLSITDRAYLMFEGTVLKAGSSASLAEDPEARKLYLGSNFKLDR